MIVAAIGKLVEQQDLTEEEAAQAMRQIMEGEATPAQIAAFLIALRMKGETIAEITGCARAMRAKATRIQAPYPNVIDTCGTGGDGSQTFNISTTAAFVVAGAGVPVAKHGNRAMSSRCGSADLLQALGVAIELSPENAETCLAEVGITFLFAPLFHSAMKHAVGPRRDLGVRTIFNILGPLTNPAGAKRQLLGVSRQEFAEPMARVLCNLGSTRAFVVHGADGLDEITLSGNTHITALEAGKIDSYTITPEQFGPAPCSSERTSGRRCTTKRRHHRGGAGGKIGAASGCSLTQCCGSTGRCWLCGRPGGRGSSWQRMPSIPAPP